MGQHKGGVPFPLLLEGVDLGVGDLLHLPVLSIVEQHQKLGVDVGGDGQGDTHRDFQILLVHHPLQSHAEAESHGIVVLLGDHMVLLRLTDVQGDGVCPLRHIIEGRPHDFRARRHIGKVRCLPGGVHGDAHLAFQLLQQLRRAPRLVLVRQQGGFQIAGVQLLDGGADLLRGLPFGTVQNLPQAVLGGNIGQVVGGTEFRPVAALPLVYIGA